MNPQAKAYKLMHDGILALRRAEQAGIRVDLEYIGREKEYMTATLDNLENEFFDTNFFKHWHHSAKRVNIYSNDQLAHFLYDVKKLKVEKTTESGKGSTDEESLRQLNIPELNTLLRIRKLRKIRDTYLDAFEREQINGYIHPFYNLHLVRTYRSSSDSPNFQNIPKRDEEAMQICRKALFPRIDHQLLEIDFSGMEVRIAACYHKDPRMLKYINDPKSDMHGDMAQQIFKIDKFDKSIPSHTTLRQAAKNGFVFPQFYGDYYINCAYNMACEWGKLPAGKWTSGQGIELSDGHLSDHLISKGINSLTKFEEHIKEIEDDFWNRRFKVYQDWKNEWWKAYKRNGYINLYTGFQCRGVMSKNDTINYPVQGAAFHCLLWCFIQVDKISREEHWNTRLIGQIHDSMLFDVDPNELTHVYKTVKDVASKRLPEEWKWIIVPMDVDAEIAQVNKSWAEKEKFFV